MAFFKQKDIGRIYVIRMTLPGDFVVWKIGMCHSSRSVDRMMEILRSWFMGFRFVPYSELRLDQETGFPRELEQHLHKLLKHKQFIPNIKVEGSTEMFVELDELRILHYIKSCSDSMFVSPMELSTIDYKHLGQLIAP